LSTPLDMAGKKSKWSNEQQLPGQRRVFQSSNTSLSNGVKDLEIRISDLASVPCATTLAAQGCFFA